ncbi:MAG TPA: DUF1573 domain-containing protein [Candidatus Coprenecus stercoravium]|uniref:DUF1573 domain-containing protein n=1 Tax=Candidatus Coprenecus stercoravium TaxID=2840735 RepID=A0A9D2K9Q0_9BACT|nr:DUF1573 domain-containing protein [Candidatus Coprenecus stercoravium]HIZ88254.1 DUF1573 domain-containing protein [Candidatus Coprenecus pullistercoris]
MKRLILSLIFASVTCAAMSQNEFGHIVSFDKVVHDFGDIMIADGPQTCTFKMKNIGDKPVVIYRVVTSCGCTEPSWTQAPVRPGETAEITVEFSNDQGPYPFNKPVTVYVSELPKPVVLKVRGVAHDKVKSLSELFPQSYGPIGFREKVVSIGQIEQGLARSVEVELANTSSRDVRVSFQDMTPGLKVSISNPVIPAKSKARIVCTVDTDMTSGEKWGKTPFTFSITVDGKKYSRVLTVEALVKENFSDLTEAQKRAGALPQFEFSSLELGLLDEGTVTESEFVVKNIGKDTFKIYKADVSEPGLSVTLPEPVMYGKKGSLKVRVDTSGQSGEVLNILTLITNSPTRPIINLFVIYTVR